MITSMHIVAADLNEMATVAFDGVTLEQLLDVDGIDYRDDYKDMRDIQRGDVDENVFWVRFTHQIHTIVIHEFHRWYVSDSGSICRQYRVRAQEDIHG